MTAIQLSLGDANAISEPASSVRTNFNESLEHYLQPYLDQLIFDIEDVMVESEAAEIPVDRETARVAFAFASFLPRSSPRPEVTFDPDGEISFDWFGPSNKLFSVSVNKSGRLAYAGRFRENSKVHGVEVLSDRIPEEILYNLGRAIR